LVLEYDTLVPGANRAGFDSDTAISSRGVNVRKRFRANSAPNNGMPGSIVPSGAGSPV
jgi:hypothetical protein